MPDQRGVADRFTLGSISATLDIVIKTLSEDRMAAATYRTEVRHELREIHEETLKTNSDIRLCKVELAEIKPKITTLEQKALDQTLRNAQSDGAVRLAGILGKAATAIWGGIGAIMVLLADRFLLPK